MTINSEIRKVGPFIGNGTATAFPFTFKVFQASDLEVVKLNVATNVETVLTLTTNYTVTLNSDQDSNPGGTVTLVGGALASGYTLTLTSDVPYLQPTDLTNQGGFYPDVINNALDRATIQIQQQGVDINRSLKVAVSSGVNTELPVPNANDLLGWDSTGTSLTNVDPSTLATVVAYATAYADVFIGDGTTQDFVLTRNPAVLYNLDVSIQGVTQEPTRDYTLSGTTISFTTAPFDTHRILVKYKEGLPNYEGDSQDVRYFPPFIGAVGTSAENKFAEIVSVKDFGAVGDGATDDTDAIIAAEASDFDRIYVPEGKYLTTYTNVNDLSKVYYGNGQLIIGGYATAREYSNKDVELPAIPYNQFAALDDQNIPETSFHTVTANVNPSPLPTTYTNYTQYVKELGYMQYSGGFNTDPGDHAKGRSGASHRKDFVYHVGQGDLTNRGFFGIVQNTLSGATHFLANPALAVEGGNVGADSSAYGAYIQHSEYVFTDGGVGIACIGNVYNYIRTSDANSLNQVWIHDRPQSGGTKPIDSVYSVAGLVKVGLDFTPATFNANNCAIAMKNNDRIYLNASCTPDSINAKWYADNVGDLYIGGYNGYFGVVFNNSPAFQVSETDVLVENANGLTLLETGLLRFAGTGQYGTGSRTATFSASNKPGTTSGAGPSQWLKISLGSALYYIPCWIE